MKYLFSFLILFTGYAVAAQDYHLDGNQVIIDKPVTFKTGTATLTADGEAALQIIKKYLDDKSYISTLRVECHTDNVGDAAKNQRLSEQRALAACNYLVLLGVDCKRLLPVGFGSSKPVESNDTPEGRAANRRMSFVNAALRGHLIGGMPADGGGKVAGDPCN